MLTWRLMPGERHTLWHGRQLCIALLLLAGGSRVLLAQSGYTPPAHATLRGWEEQARLAIFDRSGSYFGRTSDRGILQRFNERMDSEYHLDLISFDLSLSEVYDWYRRDNGARVWAGSINHLQLVQRAEFKAAVGLGDGWAAAASFNHQETLETRRSLVQLHFRKRLLDGRAQAFLLGTAKAQKPETDLELGFTWSSRLGDLTVAIAALDLFSDFIYQSLEVAAGLADTALDYTAHPYTARVALELSPSPHLRAEAYALAMSPTTVEAQSQTDPEEGFRQDERYAYAGGLLEWTPSRRTALGGFGTWVRARLVRSQQRSPEDDFDLTEQTWRLGLYAIHRFWDRFSTEAWLARVWRTEDRLRPDTTVVPNINYEDRAWEGSGIFAYRAYRGFRAELALEFAARDLLGPDRLPGGFEAEHSRLRLDLGWHFGQRALVMLGVNLDLDGDGKAPNFDGGHGRCILYW